MKPFFAIHTLISICIFAQYSASINQANVPVDDVLIQPTAQLQPVSHNISQSENQPSIHKLNALCQAYLNKLDLHQFPNVNQVALEASLALKSTIQSTLHDLIDDCRMINNHSMAQIFDSNFVNFKIGVAGLLRSIQQTIAIYMNQPDRVYLNSKYFALNTFDDWAEKVNRWKLFMRLIYTDSGEVVPVKLCNWFQKLKKRSEEAVSIVSDTALIQMIGVNQTDGNHTQMSDHLFELASLYTSINSAFKNISEYTLMGLTVEGTMDAFAEEYFVGAHNMEIVRLTGFKDDALTMDVLMRLVSRMKMMLEMMVQ